VASAPIPGDAVRWLRQRADELASVAVIQTAANTVEGEKG
jgi:hypothetical protein